MWLIGDLPFHPCPISSLPPSFTEFRPRMLWERDGSILAPQRGGPGTVHGQGPLTTCTALLPQGKVFPRLRKRNSTMRSVDLEETVMDEGRATDYVFRIIYPGHRHEHSKCPPQLMSGRRSQAQGLSGKDVGRREGAEGCLLRLAQSQMDGFHGELSAPTGALCLSFSST